MAGRTRRILTTIQIDMMPMARTIIMPKISISVAVLRRRLLMVEMLVVLMVKELRYARSL